MEKQLAISVLASLAQETRLDVFRLLVAAGPEGVSAGTIAETLGVPAATLSFHLKELKSCGVVACRRDGRTLIYSPDFQVMNGLLTYLTENCCGGISDCGVTARCENPEA
jgi:ArsR family transcriptional regulator